MPDLICPPPWQSAKPPCPCRAVRYGFGLLSMCAYSAFYSTVFLGKPFGAIVGPALRGEASIYDWPIVWMGCALVGALTFGEGVRRIARAGHSFKIGSFLWSVLVVAGVAWRLANYPNCIGQPDWLGGTITAFTWHFVRMSLVAWMAANIANIALQLIEVWPRRRPRVRRPARMPAMPRGLLHGWSRRMTMVEEIEGLPEHVATAGRSAVHPYGPPHIAPDLLEQLGDVPLIDLVPGRDGSFIPLDLPEGEPVPVKRRRR